jgi:hypothetical protein
MIRVEIQSKASCTNRFESDQVGWYGVECACGGVGGNIAATLHDVEIVAVYKWNIRIGQYEYVFSSAKPGVFERSVVILGLKLSEEEVSFHTRYRGTEGTRS